MNEPLTVYTLPNCMQCTMTKRALDNAHLPYVEIDLTSDEQAVRLVQELGFAAAPIVTVGAASWAGFRPDLIKAVAAARTIDVYQVPTDPMDDLSCDSCE